MNYTFKKICKLCLTAVVVSLINIGVNAGCENVYAESDAKKIVSISYETKKPVIINEGDDEYGRWNATKKGEYFKYYLDWIFDKTRAGDKLTITYSDNTTKELVAKKVHRYTDIADVSPEEIYESTMAFINPDSMASKYKYFYDWRQHTIYIDSEIQDTGKYYDYSFLGPYGKLFSAQDEYDDVIFFDELFFAGKQTFDKRWKAGNTYNIAIYYSGKKTKVPVTIKENGIKKISYKPAKKIKIKEETSGVWLDAVNADFISNSTDSEYSEYSEYSKNTKYSEYYSYDIEKYIYQKDSKITVTYNNNRKKVYTCKKGKFKDSKGNLFPYIIFYDDNQTSKRHWKAGKTYKISL